MFIVIEFACFWHLASDIKFSDQNNRDLQLQALEQRLQTETLSNKTRLRALEKELNDTKQALDTERYIDGVWVVVNKC